VTETNYLKKNESRTTSAKNWQQMRAEVSANIFPSIQKLSIKKEKHSQKKPFLVIWRVLIQIHSLLHVH